MYGASIREVPQQLSVTWIGGGSGAISSTGVPFGVPTPEGFARTNPKFCGFATGLSLTTLFCEK